MRGGHFQANKSRGGLHHQVWNILHLNSSRLNNMESNIDFYLYCRYCTPPEWTMPFRFSAMRGGHFQLNKSGWGGGGVIHNLVCNRPTFK